MDVTFFVMSFKCPWMSCMSVLCSMCFLKVLSTNHKPSIYNEVGGDVESKHFHGDSEVLQLPVIYVDCILQKDRSETQQNFFFFLKKETAPSPQRVKKQICMKNFTSGNTFISSPTDFRWDQLIWKEQKLNSEWNILFDLFLFGMTVNIICRSLLIHASVYLKGVSSGCSFL